MTDKVPDLPPYGSVELYEQMMRKTSGSVFPFAIGVIESIATDLHDSDAEKVRRICNALIACGRVAGVALDHFGEPDAGRVPPHLEDGRTGEAVDDTEACRVAHEPGSVDHARHYLGLEESAKHAQPRNERVEHFEASATGRTDGTCDAECECGVTVEGFGSFAEARAELALHIADATASAE
jgi:hypothetical protein